MKQQKYTIRDFNREFPDDDSCLEWLVQNRWPDGIYCDKCEQVRKHHKVTGRPVYACDYCGSHVSPMAGTIMEKSSTPLRFWFHAMFLMASTRCGISAKQLEREIGVTYKTAWRMFTLIRSTLTEDFNMEGSSVEVDESFFGGKAKNMHKAVRERRITGRGASGKTAVMGMVNRESGKVIARVVPDVKAETILPIITEKVMPASMVYSDEASQYTQLPGMGYHHKRVHHAANVYVVADAHTNSIEGFWSLVKRGIGGVNHAVSAKYLQAYVNEYAFRYSHRNQAEPMFSVVPRSDREERIGRVAMRRNE